MEGHRTTRDLRSERFEPESVEPEPVGRTHAGYMYTLAEVGAAFAERWYPTEAGYLLVSRCERAFRRSSAV